MIPYLDAGFLLTLLINTDRSPIAKTVLGECDPPYAISPLHQLQAENLFVQLERSGEMGRQRAAETGLRLWAWYFSEGLFELAEMDWTAALRLAITWNSGSRIAPPPPLLLLHPALAVISEATHFLSFDPRSRGIALQAGMKLLPETV